jgi:excisionase family DNA binding protein
MAAGKDRQAVNSAEMVEGHQIKMDGSSVETTESTKLELLTLDEAAVILKVDPTTVGRRVKSGEIAAVHIGRSVRIRRQDLEEFIVAHLDGS